MIKVIAVGKMKNRELSSLAQDYLSRSQRFDKVELVEIKDSTLPKEAEKMLEILQKNKGAIFAMGEEGKEYTSVEFAKLLEKHPHANFLIGSAYGIDKEIKQRATQIIALSKMTFTHEFARVFLLEQIYRAKNIQANTGYHHV
ncbi:MAG: 23S rRNA (pseudouridine(1915)-N(3))-methyltransferase RlmH [Opitutales bacterium]